MREQWWLPTLRQSFILLPEFDYLLLKLVVPVCALGVDGLFLADPLLVL